MLQASCHTAHRLRKPVNLSPAIPAPAPEPPRRRRPRPKRQEPAPRSTSAEATDEAEIIDIRPSAADPAASFRERMIEQMAGAAELLWQAREEPFYLAMDLQQRAELETASQMCLRIARAV